MTAAPRILVIGLDPERVPDPSAATGDATTIEQAEAALTATGADTTCCPLALDGFVDAATQAETVITGGEWDVVALVGPLASNPEHAGLREAVVATVRRHAPTAGVETVGSSTDLKAVVGRLQV